MSTIPVNSVSARDKTGNFAYHSFHRRAVGPADIHIKISYSGICHSDIHTVLGEWGEQKYPLCVGHEIIGEVVSIGSEVTKFKVGDIAGVGCFVDSCKGCDECKEGVEEYCSGPRGFTGTYGANCTEDHQPGGKTQGGYSSAIVMHQDYALKVPDNLNNAGGTPLLCAGITCYSPFKRHGIKAGDKVAVVGLGGLGHMAVKILKAMGCTVTVVSRGEGKKEMALKMGATTFVDSTNKDQMAAAAKTQHYIYDSIAFQHDVASYLNLLKSRGTIIMVGGIPKPMGVTSFNLIPRALTIAGSCIGGIKATQEMLDFCSKNNILSEVEVIPATPEAVTVAYDRAVKADVKFRFVIDTAATLPAP